MAASRRYGPLSVSTAHLCVDMQSSVGRGYAVAHAVDGERVRPVIAELARYCAHATIFTRFIPPYRPEDVSGTWRRYFDRWYELTRQNIDLELLKLVPELQELVPPATILDKQVYSPFHDGRLARYLRQREIDTLVISGTETDVCVLTAVLTAVDYGYRVVIAVDVARCSARLGLRLGGSAPLPSATRRRDLGFHGVPAANQHRGRRNRLAAGLCLPARHCCPVNSSNCCPAGTSRLMRWC